MASSTVNLKALGLNFSPNALELPPGSLVEANNVIIRRDDVIESRRGYALFGEEIPLSQTAKQLAIYRQRILRHYGDKIAYQDGVLNSGEAKFTEFSGSFTEVETGLRIKSIQSKNGNFYFTTNEGIKKISAANASEFTNASGYITQAGGIKALDLQARLNTTFGDQESFLTENSTVAYKLVWGKIDANNVEILGTPSERVVVYNPLKMLLQMNFNRLLNTLDNLSSANSVINAGDYYSTLKVTNETNAVDLRANMIALAKKIDEDLLFATDTGTGAAYQPLNITTVSSNSGLIVVNIPTPPPAATFTVVAPPTTTTITSPLHGFSNDDLVRLTTSGTLPSPLVINKNYYIKNVAVNTYELSEEVNGTSISITNAGSGTHTATVSNEYKYFNISDKIYLTDFKSNNVTIDNLNGAQIISSVSPLTFTARDYTSSNPVGISGGIASFTGTTSKSFVTNASSATVNSTAHGFSDGSVVQLTTTGILPTGSFLLSTLTDYYIKKLTDDTFQIYQDAGLTVLFTAAAAPGGLGTGTHTVTLKSSLTGIVITTPTEHKLKDNQIVNLLNTGNSYLNGLKTITVNGPTTFQLNVTGPVIAGATGTWNISIDTLTSAKIESNKYRSITEPTEIVAAEDTGIVEVRGTGAQLFAQQTYLSSIISKLKAESNNVINTTYSTSIGLSSFNLTTRASVDLEFTVPHNIDSTYYYKLYRTETTQVNALFSSPLEDLLPPVDYRLVLQNYYDSTLKSGDNTLIINDNVPAAFLNKENLYTNVNTSGGEDAKPNDYPPFAYDINTFKGYTFYANTKIKQLRDLELLGVARLKDELDAIPSRTPTVVISDGTSFNNCKISFVRGVKRIVTINVPATPPIPAALPTNVNYFDINSAGNQTKYRVWFDLTGSDAAPDAASRKLIKIYIPSNTQDDVGQKIANSLNSLINDFSCTYNSGTNVVTVNYLVDGSAAAISFAAGLSGFSSSVTTAGIGESVSGRTAVISSNDLLLPSVATAEATLSFIRVLNRNTADQVDNPSVGFDTYAYYSGTNPGLFLLEGTVFVDNPFYLTTNNAATGISFSPDISPLNTTNIAGAITSAGVSTNKALLTFSVAHGFLNNETIVISNSNSTPNIDGVYVVEYISTTQLKIDLVPSADITVAGTSFSYTKSTLAEFSDNYTRKNRVYYSKFEQPESVPVNVVTGNFIDIGSEEKKILRIFPLRDSLFVFKEDGLYRLSAETEPFTVALFDSSCILFAPDSVAVSQNLVYCWTTQGISTASESGVAIASRPIDTEVLRLQSANYPNFSTATFGVGYESDNSYIVWTVAKPSDQYATQAFRYSSLTGTWTKYTKTNNCGILNPVDDRLYLGLPTEYYIEQERKSFTREDYADRQYDFSIGVNNYFNDVIKLSSTTNVKAGDVLTQTQTLTVYQFNSLLNKLDTDPGVADTDYYSTLKAVGGDNLRTKIVALANKLDADTGVSINDFFSTIDGKSGSVTSASLTSPTQITSAGHGLISGRVIAIAGASVLNSPDINGNYEVTVINANTFSIPVSLISFTPGGTWSTKDNDFNDITACYNKIIDKLNSDLNVAFSNYLPIEGTALQEAVIISVDYIFKKVTLNKTLDFVQGPIIVYNAINSSVVYSPNTFGDPLSYKQIREATAMFASKAFTLAELSFSTDLLPAFVNVEFAGSGSGLFGNDEFGGNFFGGVSNSVPFRTIVPANCQRCRYLNIKFSHNTAREQYALFGITLTGKTFSTRAYR